MIEKMLGGEHHGVELHHVRMDFSDEMDQIGKFRWNKIWRLVRLIGAIFVGRLKSGAQAMYYPPCGPNYVPFFRDCAVLIATRWLFKRTIFHFHATGISELYPKLSPMLKMAFRWAYEYPDLTIGMTELGPRDDIALKSRRHLIIPHGIEDAAGDFDAVRSAAIPGILFVGVVGDEKGVGILLEACARLQEKGTNFRCEIVGRFESAEKEKEFREFVRAHKLEESVKFAGVLVGDEKWKAYKRADIFCFPSHFPPESFPVVLLEAMQFSLPIVSTRWKGIPSLVKEGKNGLLAPIHDPVEIANHLQSLITDSGLRTGMGRAGRESFVTDYKYETFIRRIDEAFVGVVTSPKTA